MNVKNSLKNKLSSNQLTIGSWIMIGDPVVVEVMKLAGFEWLAIDIEHTSLDLNTVENLIRVIQANQMYALVRVSKNEEVIIKRILDMGADGIIVPMVCSQNDALQAVNFSKYPPKGIRGVGLYRATGYGKEFEKYKNWVNNELIIIAQIEHKSAVENINDILGVEGIDGTLIGPYDLSSSLNCPGDFEKDIVKNSIEKVLDSCKKYKKPAGFHVVSTDAKDLQKKINQGCTFLAYGIDYLFLRDLATEGMSKINFKK